MNPDKYLSDLLYRHECVIIPGFGGFVSNYVPARVNTLDHTFNPPARVLTFNRNLNNNDGLLANSIAISENIPFSEAMSRIRSVVEGWNSDLQSGKKLSLSGIGSFLMEKGKNLIFEPDTNSNFLLDAFGLHAFKSPPVKRDDIARKLEKKLVDRIAPEKSTGGKKKKRSRTRMLVAASIIAPILFALVWIPWQTNLMEQNGMADLNPFSRFKEFSYTPRASSFTPVRSEDLIEKAPDFSTSAPFTSITLDENHPPVIVDLGHEPLPADHTKVDDLNHEKNKASHFTGRYHLIAGVFAVPSNADNYVNALRGQGLKAGIMDFPGASMRYVEVGAFDSKEEALSQLAQIRAVRPEVWLLVK